MKRNALLLMAAAICLGATTASPESSTQTEYKRIAALSPSIVEVIYAVGGEDRLAAINDFTEYPPQAKKEKPSIGGLINVDIEKVITLECDLILSPVSAMAKDRLSGLSVPLLCIPNKTIEEIRKSFIRVGELVGKKEEGEALAKQFAELTRRKEAEKDAPKGKKTLILIGYEPLWVAGGEGFLNEFIEICGGENAAGGIKKEFYAMDFESVLAAKPEIIIDISLSRTDDEDGRVRGESFWEKWPNIPAVRDGRIEFIERDLLTIPGPRVVKGLEAMKKLFDDKAVPTNEGVSGE